MNAPVEPSAGTVPANRLGVMSVCQGGGHLRGASAHEQAGVEMSYVLSGELQVTVETAVHALESGDAIASVPHSYRRTGRTSCSAPIVAVA